MTKRYIKYTCTAGKGPNFYHNNYYELVDLSDTSIVLIDAQGTEKTFSTYNRPRNYDKIRANFTTIVSNIDLDKELKI